MRRKLLFALFLLALTGVAQDLPDAPSADAPSTVRTKTFDKQFWTWAAISSAATVLDVESTKHGINVCGLHEINPLLGRNPSRARMYAITGSMTAAYNLLGIWMRKKAPKSRFWMWMPGGVTVIHSAAAAHNFALCH